MKINDIVNRAIEKAASEMTRGSLDLREIIYLAVNTGMADAYERGFAAGRAVSAEDLTAEEIAALDAPADQ